MGNVLTAAVQFPTIVFTIVLVVALVMWLLPLLGIDGGTDGAEATADGDGLLHHLGLAGVPLAVVLSLLGLVGWAVSIIAQLTVLSTVDGTGLRVVLGIVVLLLAGAIGLWVSATVGRKVGRRLEPVLAPSAADLVGRTAEVRSAVVGPDQGYGDARTTDGSTVRVDLRTRPDRPDSAEGFRLGDTVLIIDYDREHHFYLVDQLPHWL